MKFRLFPRSLVGQLVLAVAVALFVAQAVNYTLLVRGQRQQAYANGGGMAVARIIDAMERERRGAVDEPDHRGADDHDAEKRKSRQQIRDTPFVPPPRARPDADLAEHVDAQLTQAGIDSRQVLAWTVKQPPQAQRFRGPARTAIVSAEIGGRYVVVRSWLPAEGKHLQGFLIWQTLLLYLLILVPVLLIAWRAAQPLRSLTQAVRRDPTGDGPPLVEEGPSDVRDVIGAFNASRARIGTMLADKDRMLGAVGHDLRTPLASLRLRVEQVDNDRLRDAMIASIENMAAMLEDILALARTGQPRETPENTDVVALVRELVDEYTALDRPVLLMVEDGLRDHRDIRPIGLQRALRNLIDNAVSYAGAARVAVGKDRDGLKIRVEDDGPGIPEDQIETIMEPFTRLEESRNRNTGGSGLGLALARAAVQAEGGQIILTNRVPRGLTAMIQLPSHA